MSKLICGIDEAGRGPVIGPLVMCGLMVKEEEEKKLVDLGVQDSKLLTKIKREELFDKIKKISYKQEVVVVNVDEIDKAVNGEDGLNLNWLEARKTAEIINLLKPDKVIVDAPGNNIDSYKQYLMKYVKNKKIELILEHKADMNYPVVSAASIIAKVTRDNEIEKIKKKIKIDFGSGYPADPRTSAFVKKYYKKHEKIFRKSWTTYQNVLKKKTQSNLDDFSQFKKKDN
jgi:ribonuclease HII